MSASASDKFKKLTNNFSTTLSAAIVGAGDTSMSLTSTTNLPTDTGTVFVIDRVDSAGVASPSLREYVKGTVSGTSVTNLVRGLGGSTAQAHSTGAVVEQVVDQNTLNDSVDGILVGHNQDGTHASNLPLTTPQITTGIKDANGNTWIGQTPASSAVNYVNNTNAATGNDPVLAAAGSDSNINLNLRGKGLAKTVTIGKGAVTVFAYDYVASGCVWSADSAGSTLAGSMTSGVVVINGNPITVAAVSAHSFTASKDTYVDVLDAGDGTGTVVYTEATNNATSPALASNSVRIAIVVTGASSIAAASSINQGQEDRVLPIASSVAYSVTDSLGNLICPRDPNRKILGYRRITSNVTTSSSSAAQATGLSVPVIVPSNRKIKVSAFTPQLATGTGSSGVYMSIWEGTVGSGTQIADWRPIISSTGGTGETGGSPYAIVTPSSSSKTYNVGFQNTSSVTTTMYASSTGPAFVMVELM